MEQSVVFQVFKCQSRLDNNIYAVKKIGVNQRGAELQRILREVNTLSRISAKYVLRYYWAWIETSDGVAMHDFFSGQSISGDLIFRKMSRFSAKVFEYM